MRLPTYTVFAARSHDGGLGGVGVGDHRHVVGLGRSRHTADRPLSLSSSSSQKQPLPAVYLLIGLHLLPPLPVAFFFLPSSPLSLSLSFNDA